MLEWWAAYHVTVQLGMAAALLRFGFTETESSHPDLGYGYFGQFLFIWWALHWIYWAMQP